MAEKRIEGELLENAKVTEVLIDWGVFRNDGGSRRFLRAPFKFVTMGGERYFMPEPIGGFDFPVEASLYDSDTWDEPRIQGREDFGFLTGKRITMEPNTMGDWENEDSLKGLHKIGYM